MENHETPQKTTEQPREQTQLFNNDIIAMMLMDVPEICSLLSFQLVCKDWKEIIQQTWFKKNHFERYKPTYEPLQLLVVKEEVSSLVLCEIPMVSDADFKRRRIWMPRDLGRYGQFGGSCNGLLCIEVKGEITVFNPVTRDKVTLPQPTYIQGYGFDEYEIIHVDLLFHSATGEYKVMLFYQNCTMRCDANIYTLGPNGSWRRLGEIRCFPTKGGVNVEDTIYWCSLSGNDAIISFDLSTEKIDVQFSKMQDLMLLGVSNWDSKLCTVGYGWESRQSHPTMKVWTLDKSAEHPWPGTLRYETQLEGINGDVWLLAQYSIQKNRLTYATSDAIFFDNLSGNPDDVIKVTWPLSSEIKSCFAYVESLLLCRIK